MIKKLRVIVDGNPYDVTVEVLEEGDSGAAAAPTLTSAAPAAAEVQPVAPPAPAPVTASVDSRPGNVLSPLAGRVITVVVKVGQEVKENDHLLTLEAMKMNTFVFAPKAGSVLEINIGVGDGVTEGQILVRLS